MYPPKMTNKSKHQTQKQKKQKKHETKNCYHLTRISKHSEGWKIQFQIMGDITPVMNHIAKIIGEWLHEFIDTMDSTDDPYWTPVHASGITLEMTVKRLEEFGDYCFKTNKFYDSVLEFMRDWATDMSISEDMIKFSKNCCN